LVTEYIRDNMRSSSLFLYGVAPSRSWESGLSDRYQRIWPRSCSWASHDQGPIAPSLPSRFSRSYFVQHLN